MTPSNANPPATILLIDDDPLVGVLVREIVEGLGLTLLWADNGAKGLAVAEAANPDLILVDILMPGMDGIEACRRLKAKSETHTIPVVFLSGLDELEEKMNGFRAGGIDYITKPVQKPELVARITAHLHQRRRLEGLRQQLGDYQRRFGTRTVDAADMAPPGLTGQRLERITQARELLTRDLANPPSLADLAETLNTNPKRLSHDFEALYGMTVFAWLREHRLYQACTLLRNTDFAVEQIAEQVGYNSGANFATAFRRRFKVTPREYRGMGGAADASGVEAD